MTTQIAVKLPDALVEEIDRLVGEGRFDSRSQAVRSGLDAVIAASRRDAIDDAFRAGFARHPETDAEIAEAARLAIESIDDEPWERWW